MLAIVEKCKPSSLNSISNESTFISAEVSHFNSTELWKVVAENELSKACNTVSASILSHIVDYRRLLESYSHSILPFIEWKVTDDNNVKILNETADYYKYYDATAQAEFLFDCIEDTIENIIPQEVKYLQQYDAFKNYLDNNFEMPDKMVALLVKLLSQNNGLLSNKKRESDFANLSKDDVSTIEMVYRSIFE